MAGDEIDDELHQYIFLPGIALSNQQGKCNEGIVVDLPIPIRGEHACAI